MGFFGLMIRLVYKQGEISVTSVTIDAEVVLIELSRASEQSLFSDVSAASPTASNWENASDARLGRGISPASPSNSLTRHKDSRRIQYW
jgi:hypothetical protein